MNQQGESRQDVVSRRMKQVFILFAIIGGFFIVAEHRAHLIPYLPWLFLAVCPLMPRIHAPRAWRPSAPRQRR